MESIFQRLGYTTTIEAEGGQLVQLIIINNPDGTPRWVCSAFAPKPYFLRFYNVSSFKSQLFATLVKFVFFLGLQRTIFKGTQLYMKATTGKPILDIFQNNWALFMGTKGPNKKAVLYQEDASGSRFFKIATTSKAKQLIAREAAMTETLAALQVERFKFPSCQTFSSDVIELEDIGKDGKRTNELGEAHFAALDELYQKTHYTTTLNCRERIIGLLEIQDSRIPKGLLKKLILLHNSIKNKPIQIALAHGDFTPWNMYVKDGRLAIYDWELKSHNMPIGFDAYHFILQQAILVERKPWDSIKACIQAKVVPAAFSKWIKEEEKDWRHYLKWYLFLNTSEQLLLYSQQEEWHPQIEWLLQTWNTAISDMLQYQVKHRKLLIMDIFDYLHNKKYAAIKFPNMAPEQLSEYADIDLCVEKADVADMIRYLKAHPVVQQVQERRQAHMTSVHVFLKDGKLLCLDLIWKFQRKSLTMMDAGLVLERTFRNDYGIQQMHIKDLAQYIGLFYGLNQQEIPAKYKHYILALSGCKHPLDQCLYRSYREDKIPTSKLKNILKQAPHNNLFARAWSQIAYLIHTVQQLIFSKGMIITFSGVDGAGKSTVIENVQQELEKRLRKRVVVLRHRPSVLPILSAWTKGKAKAEQDAATTLPRQGKNSSSIGSLLRFAYYYTDYLLGQFYVYCRYVLRGDVLLYDRYYFDFINDSKRSNIQLPKGLARFGYNFLMQPDYNFFLYADADTILARKQELDRNTIEQLTQQYLSLFEDLNRKGKQRYFPIENIKLSKTIDFILQRTQGGFVV